MSSLARIILRSKHLLDGPKKIYHQYKMLLEDISHQPHFSERLNIARKVKTRED